MNKIYFNGAVFFLILTLTCVRLPEYIPDAVTPIVLEHSSKIEDKIDKEEQLHEIYEYLRKNIAAVDITNAYEYDATRVLEEKKANCTGFGYAMNALAKAKKIQDLKYYSMFYSADAGYMDRYYISEMHEVTGLVIGGDTNIYEFGNSNNVVLKASGRRKNTYIALSRCEVVNSLSISAMAYTNSDLLSIDNPGIKKMVAENKCLGPYEAIVIAVVNSGVRGNECKELNSFYVKCQAYYKKHGITNNSKYLMAIRLFSKYLYFNDRFHAAYSNLITNGYDSMLSEMSEGKKILSVSKYIPGFIYYDFVVSKIFYHVGDKRRFYYTFGAFIVPWTMRRTKNATRPTETFYRLLDERERDMWEMKDLWDTLNAERAFTPTYLEELTR